ncbi:MAG: hypothetical protein A2252_07000 [Elusimicrobia bacterium RIFOXYA2_FULL_39_19]|nr:MAG: hypothetical protein A2252_07000 [Elusimicrobia bacterium RIFOXYA2_FULL_39_19]
MGYNFLSTFLSIVTLLLLTFVLVRQKKTVLHYEFGLILLVLAFAFFAKHMSFTETTLENITKWERIIHSANVLFAATLVLFCYNLTRDKFNITFGIISYITAAILILIINSKYGIAGIENVNPIKYHTGSLYPVTRIPLLFVLFYSLYEVIRASIISKGLKKLQLQYIILSLILFLIVGMVYGLLMPLMGNWQSTLYAMILNFFPLIIITYALSPRLLSTKIVFYNSFKYILIAIVMIVCDTLISSSFKIHHTFSLIITMVLTSIVYFPLFTKNSFSHIIENIVLRKRLEYQSLLVETSAAVVKILDVFQLLDFTVSSLYRALKTEKIGIFLTETIQNKTMLKLHANRGLNNLKTGYIFNQKLITLFTSKKSTLIIDSSFNRLSNNESEEYKEIITELTQFGTMLVLPIINKSELIGIITFDQKKSTGDFFDIQDIEILESLAVNLGIAISNARLYKELDDTYLRITRALSLVLETKDSYTVGHSDNVTKYSLIIAKKLNLPETEIVKVAQASMLHDLGKIGVHDYILEKRTKLTPEEWEEIKLHTIKGAKILDSLPFLKEVSSIVKHHHEHFNGNGYPSHQKGNEIPLGSQILGIADAFDAMTTERPYKSNKLGIEDAINELIKNSGTQFNPEIVKLFIESIRDNPNILTSKKIMQGEM